MIRLQMFPETNDIARKATLVNKAMVSSVDIKEHWFHPNENHLKVFPDARSELLGYEAIVHMAGGERLCIQEPQLDTVITKLRQLLDVVILRPYENNFLQGSEVHRKWCDKCKYHRPEQEKHHTNSKECRMCFDACNFRKVEKEET
jgi:hypothetical protein